MTFNLVTEPWVRAVTVDGTPTTLSLKDVFTRAGTIRSLAGELETQNVAILRVLLAILQRALDAAAPDGEDTIRERVELVRTDWDEFAVPAVHAYLDAHAHRFDLFDADAPFMQVPGMAAMNGKLGPVRKLVYDMPDNHSFMTSRSSGSVATLTHAEAARWLINVHAFDLAGIKTGMVGQAGVQGGKAYGKKGERGLTWGAQGRLVHLVGATLLDTLLLNVWAVLLPARDRVNDLPAWERPVDTVHPDGDMPSRPSGPVDLFTWQGRRVLLRSDGTRVTSAAVTYGDHVNMADRQGVTLLEPMATWQAVKVKDGPAGTTGETGDARDDGETPTMKDTFHQVRDRRNPTSPMWQGLSAVMVTDTQKSASDPKPCLTAVHASRLAGSNLLPGGVVSYATLTVETDSKNAVVKSAWFDALDLPSTILEPGQVDLRRAALDAVTAASAAVNALSAFAYQVAAASGFKKDRSNDIRADIANVERAAAYHSLDMAFRSWLRDTLTAGDVRAAERAWQVTVRKLVNTQRSRIVNDAPARAWTHPEHSLGTAEENYQSRMFRAVPHAYPPRPVPDNPPSADVPPVALTSTFNTAGKAAA